MPAIFRSPAARKRAIFLAAVTAITVITITFVGCAAVNPATQTQVEAAGVTGSLHGGQQPISGALVQLIAPGTSGYGSAGTVITSATTGAGGGFTLPRPYTCPANSGLVYLLATGGNAGAGSNSSIAEAAVLGPCSALSATTFINITEVTTVAAAYALAPFATVTTGSTVIATSATNLQGLTNAAGAANNLASTSTGLAHGASDFPGITVPTATLNTLADIIAACVNQGSGTTSTSTCATLFSNATPPGGVAPTDTFQAAIDIALNPGNNAATLFNLAAANPPYMSTLASAPADFALGLSFTGANLNGAAGGSGPTGVDIDVSGNVFVAVTGPSTVRGVVEISPAGVYLSGNTSPYNLPNAAGLAALAVNPAGNIEVASYGTNQIFEITPTGTAPSGTTTFSVSSAASFNGPLGIAVDNRNGSTWAANTGGTTPSSEGTTSTHISNAGVELSSSPFTVGPAPIGVAIDGSGDIWVASSDQYNGGINCSITELVPSSGNAYTASTFATGAGTTPFDIAIDNAGAVWTTRYYGVGKNSNTGAAISPSAGYEPVSPNAQALSPFGIAIDGLGRAFVSNQPRTSSTAPGTLTIFNSAGTLVSTSSTGTGYTANGILPTTPYAPKGVAIDASGNVWISGGSPNALVELIGLAAPVLTPLSVANSPNKLGTRP